MARRKCPNTAHSQSRGRRQTYTADYVVLLHNVGESGFLEKIAAAVPCLTTAPDGEYHTIHLCELAGVWNKSILHQGKICLVC